jgi:hypothetical protein
VIDFIVRKRRSGREHPARFDGLPAEKMQRDQAGELSVGQEFLTQ